MNTNDDITFLEIAANETIRDLREAGLNGADAYRLFRDAATSGELYGAEAANSSLAALRDYGTPMTVDQREVVMGIVEDLISAGADLLTELAEVTGKTPDELTA